MINPISALALAQGLLALQPNRRFSLEKMLNNSWLREMDTQCHSVPAVENLMPTESVNSHGSSDKGPLAHEISAIPSHQRHEREDLVAAPSDENLRTIQSGSRDAVEPVVIPVDGNVRDVQLVKRRSSRISDLVQKKRGLYWLYRSGLERGEP